MGKFLRLIVIGFLLLPLCALAGDKPWPVSEIAATGWTISEPLKVSDLEYQSLTEILPDADTVPQIPFGFANSDWLKFKDKIEPGDVLVKVSAPAPSPWYFYAILRSGVVAETFSTIQR